MQFFISYQRLDLEFARRLKSRLELWGHSAWLDVDNIPKGAKWDDEKHQGLRQSQAVIGLLTPESLESHNVLDEWTWALEFGRRLYLIWLRDVVVEDIPPRLNRLHRFDFRQDEALGFEELNKTLSIRTLFTVPSVEATPKVASEIFVSYSHQNHEYVKNLCKALEQKDFTVWMDERIDYGERWFQTIIKAIRECSIFIVVMTPEAEKSEWVEREILIAQKYLKPIYPLLLKGREFDLLITTQYVDVTNGQLPPQKFFSQLKEITKPHNTSTQ